VIALVVAALLTVINVGLELVSRRRLRRLEAMKRETDAIRRETADPEFVHAQAAVIYRSFVARLRALVEREPPSPIRDRALAVVDHFERAIARDGRGLS
jgi:hypothetical protein